MEGYRLRSEELITGAHGRRMRILRNWCVNHVIDLDCNRPDTDAEVVDDIADILKAVRGFFWNPDYKKELIRTCKRFRVKLKTVPKEFELRWVRHISRAL